MGSYDTTAEYHEVHMQPAWDRISDLVQETFGELGVDDVVVDIGAGSGMGSVVLTGCCAAEVIALEPNDTMRAMMVARLDQVGVLERVTVMADAVPEGLGRLPERVDGVVATHMLGHLSGPARTDLFEWIASSLAPGGSALLTASIEDAPEIHEPVVVDRAVGRFVYRVTYEMPAPNRIEGLWEVIDDEQRVVRSVTDSDSWDTVTVVDIRTALAGHDVEVTEPLAGVAMVTRGER